MLATFAGDLASFAPVSSKRRLMKRCIFVLLVAVMSTSLFAQDRKASGNHPYSIKVQGFMGGYLSPSGNIKDISPNAPTGINFGVELPSTRQKPWQQYLNDPAVGVGMSYLNFGNDVMGEGIALYPYIMINALNENRCQIKLKVASGLVAVNNYYKMTLDEEIPNRTFGSLINAYLSAGLNADFSINKNLKINTELGFYHISNGRISEPNKGVNVLYGGVGLIATLNPDEGKELEPKKFPDLPYKWSLNITGAAGVQNADIDDDRRFFVSTFHIGGIYSLTNWYGIGLGVDVFYNDAVSDLTKRNLYCPKHQYTNAQKTRMGVSWNNEFKFGDVTALVDWGVYLINPVRHYYEVDHTAYGCDHRLPLFYKSEGPGGQETFHYIRFGLKYRIWDNLYVQALAKTHLHICECIEFGIGYQIPFTRKDDRAKYGKIFHHTRSWWE